jgi:fatty acid desaturase
MTTTASIELAPYIHCRRPLWNAIAISYTLLGYGGGIVLLLLPQLWLNLAGLLLLSHSLILSAYLSHELMHGSIFTSMQCNARWGNVMLWLNGGCYARFKDLARRHIAHHADRVDFSAFNLADALRALPAPIRWGILALEWVYIPAIAFWLRWRSMLLPFVSGSRCDERWRIALLLLIRGSLFTLLALVSVKALFLYFLAYLVMITVLRWQDAFQHTYEVFPIGTSLPKRDRAHEQANTFSTLISQQYPWLNLVLLNFGYHNAHHEVMSCPWYALPDLDRAIFTGTEVHYIPLRQLLRNYHRFRLTRFFSGQGEAVNAAGQPTPDRFYGAIGVSFLVLTS